MVGGLGAMLLGKITRDKKMEFNLFSFFETIGLGIFLFYLIRGLKSKIKGLEGTIEAQNKTLSVMEKRNEETEKISNIYKNLINDLPTDLENYRTIISKTKDEMIFELKNQNEDMKKKLSDTQKHIESSSNTKEIIAHHLLILKSLVSKKKPKFKYGIPREYYLAKLCESGSRSLENSVALIYQSSTLEEFLTSNNYHLYLTEDYSIISESFNKHQSPDGQPIYEGFATLPFNEENTWHAIINQNLYVSSKRFSELKDEFSALKTFV